MIDINSCKQNNIIKQLSFIKINWLYLVAFMLPLYSLSPRLGIEISLYKILPIIAFILHVKNKFIFPRQPTLIFLLLVSYLFLNTIYNYVSNIDHGLFVDAINTGWSKGRAYLHMPIQFISLTLMLSIVLTSRPFVQSRLNINKFINGFINGNIFSILFGICLIISVSFFDFSGLSGLVFPDGNWIRLSGLGGEPRHFSAFLLIALFILISTYDEDVFNIKNINFKLITLVIALFMSFSTSAILAFILSILAILLLGRVKLNYKLIVKLIMPISILILIFSAELYEIIRSSKFDRLTSIDNILYFVPKDSIAISFLLNDWRALLFGVGSGGITYHTMNSEFLSTINNSAVNTIIIKSVLNGQLLGSLTPSTFFLKFVSEFGMVGYSLLLFTCYKFVKEVDFSKYNRVIKNISIMVFVSSFIASALIVHIYIILIALIYSHCLYNKQKD